MKPTMHIFAISLVRKKKKKELSALKIRDKIKNIGDIA